MGLRPCIDGKLGHRRRNNWHPRHWWEATSTKHQYGRWWIQGTAMPGQVDPTIKEGTLKAWRTLECERRRILKTSVTEDTHTYSYR